MSWTNIRSSFPRLYDSTTGSGFSPVPTPSAHSTNSSQPQISLSTRWKPNRIPQQYRTYPLTIDSWNVQDSVCA